MTRQKWKALHESLNEEGRLLLEGTTTINNCTGWHYVNMQDHQIETLIEEFKNENETNEGTS